MFCLWPRTQVAIAPRRAPAVSAAGMTTPVTACAQRKPPPPDFSGVAYAPDPGLAPALMSTAPPPDPLKLRVGAEPLRHALPMPAAEILQFHTN